MSIREFMDEYFLHFNAATVVSAAEAWKAHHDGGAKMLVSLAGAMSTARIGRLLAPMIDAGWVHAISCTGANLEEDVFNLVAGEEYEVIPDWRALSAEEDKALYDRGMNRVTDICIPETVMRHIEQRLRDRWKQAERDGVTKLPSEHLKDVLADTTLDAHLQRPRSESWLDAARRNDIPVFTPGWEDSTTGNMFSAAVYDGTVGRHDVVASGTEQMVRLIEWYKAQHEAGSTVGFFQIGGGIAGDFAICAVPLMIQDLQMNDIPFWSYFCQISDAVTSYGGYSGAPPNEKITWGKLDVDTPKFMIQSDATIVAPLIFGWLMNR
jgi:deoxyhypusine synthase